MFFAVCLFEEKKCKGEGKASIGTKAFTRKGLEPNPAKIGLFWGKSIVCVEG